ncbi:DUF1638 domain-containing protein [Phosphitispora fastidiosa]|uniref:DUF1638 domain-containing protein n=1 Tax=Phosphitispora fastidiosa TaxID=2837202 RepID=UPI001E5EB1F3|nr:DUF1638 domain-containing protein [Phosphitispora fastidiosa]MBU7007886.1 hypothetical protein [Phosphitispora fastidiosa]
MKTVFVACSMLKAEIEKVMEELNSENRILFFDAALHVDFDRLEKALVSRLEEAGKDEKPAVLVGTKCHPEIQDIIARYQAKIVSGINCIELLLGEKMKDLDAEAKTFYVSYGWLKNWKKIFVEELKWDSVDARINFGYYDRIVYIDTGLQEINDEEVLEFYEYTGVPLEIYPVDLENMKKEIGRLIG